MKEKRKSKAGRNPKLDPAVYRYTVRFNEEEHNRFLAMFGKSGVYKLEQHTVELVKLSRRIVELSREMEAKWSQKSV